ncbi:MAG: hypothetical protein KC983_01960 [Phycisphaerales bacterium]|nr:hypothetical protein [Phycisphaerales bacterium]
MIGADPTITGWLICLGACAASALSWRAALRQRAQPRTGVRFWLAMAAIMLFFGLNTELDLQTTMINAARDLAKSQGWYGQRDLVQRGFLIAFTVAMLALAVWLAMKAWFGTWAARMGLLSVGMLFAFVLIRAVQIGRQGDVLPSAVNSRGLTTSLEVAGIAGVMISAWIAGRKPSPAA